MWTLLWEGTIDKFFARELQNFSVYIILQKLNELNSYRPRKELGFGVWTYLGDNECF